MSFDLGLSSRRALVTAGTKGVGAAVVEVLLENGANVVTTARSIPPNSLAGVHYVAANITTAGAHPCRTQRARPPWRHRHRRQRGAEAESSTRYSRPLRGRDLLYPAEAGHSNLSS